MASINHKRKEATFFRILAEIITEEVQNSDVSFPTVTGVKLSNDGSHLVVYVSFDSHGQKSLDGLNRAKGFIKARLSKAHSFRKTPSLVFKIDTAVQEGRRIEDILNNIKK